MMKEPRQVWKRREQSQGWRELVVLSRRGKKRLRGGGGQAIRGEGRRLEASPVRSLAEDGAGGECLSIEFGSFQEVLAIMPLARTCLLPTSPQNHIFPLQDLILPTPSLASPCLQPHGS